MRFPERAKIGDTQHTHTHAKTLRSTIKYSDFELLSPGTAPFPLLCALIRLIKSKCDAYVLMPASCNLQIPLPPVCRCFSLETQFYPGFQCTEFAFVFFLAAVQSDDKLFLRVCVPRFCARIKRQPNERLPHRIISSDAKTDEIATIFNGNLIR